MPPLEFPFRVSRRHALFALGAAISVAGAGWLVGVRSSPRDPDTRANAAELPTLTFSGVDRDDIELTRLRGRALVLHCWATWCAPCRKEMPALSEFHARALAEGIGVVALALEADAHPVREWLLQTRVNVPAYVTPSPHEAYAALGLKALPSTLLVSRGGRVMRRLHGPQSWAQLSAREMSRELSA